MKTILAPVIELCEQDLSAPVWNGGNESLSSVVIVSPDILKLDDARLAKIWDRMWSASETHFIVLVDDPTSLIEFVSRHAYRLAFGWTDVDRKPHSPGDVVHIDDFYYRNQCGFQKDDWLCGHQNSEDGGCSYSTCPLAHGLYDLVQLEAIGLSRDQFHIEDGGTEEEFVYDSDWMKLHSRPARAQARNVILGFRAPNRWLWAKRAREFRYLREVLGPYATLFAVVGDFDLKIPYWPLHEYGTDIGFDPTWDATSPRKYQHGGDSMLVPTLNYVFR